ncbi:MAG: hypothetical protein WC003_14455 [Terrimicrobiaceae bacterium]
MSPTDIHFQGLPLVFTAPGSPVHDLVAAAGDEASDEMSRSIWGDFRRDLLRRLESLGETLDRKDLTDELHALRGSSSQFGLFLLEVFLFAWEKKEPDPVGAASRYLPGSLAIAGLSLAAIENDFPHLKSSGG